MSDEDYRSYFQAETEKHIKFINQFIHDYKIMETIEDYERNVQQNSVIEDELAKFFEARDEDKMKFFDEFSGYYDWDDNFRYTPDQIGGMFNLFNDVYRIDKNNKGVMEKFVQEPRIKEMIRNMKISVDVRNLGHCAYIVEYVNRDHHSRGFDKRQKKELDDLKDDIKLFKISTKEINTEIMKIKQKQQDRNDINKKEEQR